jgi:UPF0755 protein
MKKNKKIILIILLVLALIGGGTAIHFYNTLFSSNIQKDADEYLYIPTNSSFEDVVRIIKIKNIIQDDETFAWVAKRMKYSKVKPGKYKLKKGMSNVELIRMLRAGRQEPVKIQFQNIRLKKDFAGYIGSKLELDSTKLLSMLDSMDYLRTLGFDEDNIFCMFIPNTYEFYWNTSEEKFISKMKEEYDNFWNEERINKAERINLSKTEVIILASIVDQEALVNAELRRVAGVYMNRLNKGMKLEADPTVIFAIGDFSIKRVLNRMLQYNSPYNTYKYNGLPPGPICMPSVAAIDATLAYEKHNYIYFCAKEDFSGYHNFASNLAQHQANARKFQQALTKRRIMK